MYISSANNILNDYWRYLIGIGITIMGIFIFSLPHLIGISIKIFSGSVDESKLSDTHYLMTLFDSNINLIFILLPFVGGLLFLFLTVRFLHKQTLTQLTTVRKCIDWNRFWFSLIIWGFISVSLIGIDYYSNPEHYENNFNLYSFLILCSISVILIPLQTSFEEYFFRGYLMQGIGLLANRRWVPLILTSLIFGLLHIANPEIEKLGYILLVYYIGTGLFLGIITLMDDGLELALGFHLANNLFTALLVTADWTAFQTNSVFKDISEPTKASFSDVFMPVFIIFPLILFVFAKKYQWINWKQKLFGKVKKLNEFVESQKQD